jgi:hypothetical protein
MRSDAAGSAILQAYDGKVTIFVSDANWGCLEKTIDGLVAMDSNMDGAISNAEAVRYLNALDKETVTSKELVDAVAAWRQNVGNKRILTTRTDVLESFVERKEVLDDALIREPGSDVEPSGTRGSTLMTYWDVDDLNSRLEMLCALHPDICLERYVGRSVEGRDIMALRISCCAESEDCPEYLVAAGIHGDERIGTWVAMKLAETIVADLEGAEEDSIYRPLLEQCALWIVPSMNPDGASAKLPTRDNANSHDLNRSFPDGALQTLGTCAAGDSMMSSKLLPVMEKKSRVTTFPATEVPETTAFMRFCMEHPFTAALHLHSGSFLVCYPYGNNAAMEQVYTQTPDDALFRTLADAYCDAYDGNMRSINSCEWYPVNGEAPDWQYRYMGTYPLTVELVEMKEPKYLESCESVWTRHADCFRAWLEACLIATKYSTDTRKEAQTADKMVTVSWEFSRLMPYESVPFTVAVNSGNVQGDKARALNMACECGLEANLPKEDIRCVIGRRTETDGSMSLLLYSLEDAIEESFEINVRSTDNVANDDHIVSFTVISSSKEERLFRKQLLLSEKRKFVWTLSEGWNFLSSPIYGEQLLSGDNCLTSRNSNGGNASPVVLGAEDFRPSQTLWVYSDEKQYLAVDGLMGTQEATLRKGWNAIGSLYYQRQNGSCFAVEGMNYVITNDMFPGKGYWIFVR